jgi:hypothetical protein
MCNNLGYHQIFWHNMPGSRHSYVTLVTSELLAIIKEYLEFRRGQGKRVVAESPQKAEANRPHPILKGVIMFPN